MPNFKDFAPLYDYSLWEQAIQEFFCDPVQGGGLFVSPPATGQTNTPTGAAPAVNPEEWEAPEGLVAFFTGFESAVFKKARPRVSINPISYTPLNQRALVLDANGRLQNRSFTVPLEFVVVTKADYDFHTQWLATVRSIIAQMNPVAEPLSGTDSLTSIQTTGLNAFLEVHELAQIWDAGNSLALGITPDKGAYVTTIKYNASFAVRANAWPGGTLTT